MTINTVRILDESLNEIWSDVSVMDITITEEKTPTKFAVETGAERSDHVVESATEISITFMLTGDIATQYHDMKTYFNMNSLLTIVTKTGVFPDMLINDFPQSQTNDMTDGAVLSLTFSEWIEVTPETGELSKTDVSRGGDASSINRGTQQPQEQKSSAMSEWDRGVADGLK